MASSLLSNLNSRAKERNASEAAHPVVAFTGMDWIGRSHLHERTAYLAFYPRLDSRLKSCALGMTFPDWEKMIPW